MFGAARRIGFRAETCDIATFPAGRARQSPGGVRYHYVPYRVRTANRRRDRLARNRLLFVAVVQARYLELIADLRPRSINGVGRQLQDARGLERNA